MEIDYEIVHAARELEKQGFPEDTIESKLKEMGYTTEQVREIIRLTDGVDSIELQQKGKKVLLALVVSSVFFVGLMAIIAIVLQ